jgi:hypothetical protein
VVGHAGDVEAHALGDLALHARLAAGEPERQPQREVRPAAQQHQGRLVQQVGAQQRAVEVHDQRHISHG